MNVWVEQYLQPWTVSHPCAWAAMLPMAEYAHNLWRHDMLKTMPHEMLFRFQPQVNVKFQTEDVPATLERLKLMQGVQHTATQ